jgi:uncharacterized damage-inducible protein DinB
MMQGLADLFRRDLTRLAQELRAFPDEEALWATLPGVTNSAGNLTRHLEGNLRHYIGFQLGGVPFARSREEEFGCKGIAVAEMVRRAEQLQPFIPDIVTGLTQAQLEAPFPEPLWGGERTTSQFLFHLYGHFNYHLGQIGYLRRILTSGQAVKFVQL